MEQKTKKTGIFLPRKKTANKDVLEEERINPRMFSVAELCPPLNEVLKSGTLDLNLLMEAFKRVDGAVRVDALWLVKKLIDAKKVEKPLELASMLEKIKQPNSATEALEAALYIYGKYGDKKHARILKKSLKHEDYFIRVEAKKALSAMKRRGII